jgi:tripartite-type tricarboxylate transporter receptor subunit TctC
MLPAQTPTVRITRLHRAFEAALADSATRDKLSASGADPVGDSPETFAAFLRADLARWARVTRSANAKID